MAAVDVPALRGAVLVRDDARAADDFGLAAERRDGRRERGRRLDLAAQVEQRATVEAVAHLEAARHALHLRN